MTDLTIKQVDGLYVVHDGDTPVSAPILDLRAAEQLRALLQAKPKPNEVHTPWNV